MFEGEKEVNTVKIWEQGEFWERIREMGKCFIMEGLVNQDQELKCQGKLLEVGKRGGGGGIKCDLYF